MIIRLCVTLCLLFVVCGYDRISSSPFSIHNSLPLLQKQPQLVSFCELLSNPEKYDQKTVSTEAILIIYTVAQVDGGESFFYEPSCDKQSSYILASGTDNSQSSDPSAVALLNIIVEKAKKKKRVARAKVTVTGKFFVAKTSQAGFGHLSWAKLKLDGVQLFSVREVSKPTPWPISFKLKH